MATRILHCGSSIKNYNICVDKKIAGFTTGGERAGDIVYLAVKYNKKSYCGARYVLDEVTDYKPWPDSERYVLSYFAKDLEFCKPFDLSVLAQTGGPHWGPKYLQGAKSINDKRIVDLLNNTFIKNKSESFYRFDEAESKEMELDNEIKEIEIENLKAVNENPDLEVKIMGTFQTINFTYESDVIMGLEKLVSDNFFSLFQQYPENRAILISENRLFKTQGYKHEDNYVTGVSGIPDAILINFTKNSNNPLQINLVEYECYGESKTRATDKSNYLNSKIIPQLIRFASIFSVITDQNTRENTIKDWIGKILNYINRDSLLEQKLIEWIKELNPGIRERTIDLEISKLLESSFRTNLKIILIIDELTSEQRATIKNVINSFKLGDTSIGFDGYVVKLIQKIKISETESEYALTVQ